MAVPGVQALLPHWLRTAPFEKGAPRAPPGADLRRHRAGPLPVAAGADRRAHGGRGDRGHGDRAGGPL